MEHSRIRLWISLHVNGEIYSKDADLFMIDRTPEMSSVNVDLARHELREYVSLLLTYGYKPLGIKVVLSSLFVGDNATLSENGNIKTFPCFYIVRGGRLGNEFKKFVGEVTFVREI